MRFRTTGKMMPPNYARKAAPFANANDIYKFFAVEDVHQNSIASFDQAVAVGFGFFFNFNWNLAHELYRGQIILAQVSASGFGQARLFYELDQADLRGNVSVFGRSLVLRNDAGTSLQDGRGMNVALIVEELRHANFFAENPSYLCHCLFFSPLTSLAVWLLAGASPLLD